jgi:two-component system, OmpR family, response regulator ChvI
MLKEKEILLKGNNHKYTVDSIKNKNLAGTATVIILSRPYIARPIVINQDNNSLIHFRQIKSCYPFTNSNNACQAYDNLADAAISKPSTEEKMRILIVDDEPDIASLFKIGLEYEGGFEVDVYNDPIVALSNYKPGLYDLLLLDIKMPKMNGLELYQNIREKYKGKENGGVKVCFITAFEEYYKQFERLFPNLELDCFIRKPISIDKLVEVVKTKLDLYG